MQFYLDARPIRLDAVLAELRADVEAAAGPAPTRTRPARDAIALSRWRLYAALEQSLRLHGEAQAAVALARLRGGPVAAAPARRARRAAARRAGAAGARASASIGARRARARRTSTRCARSSRRSGCRCASSTAARCSGCCGSA